MRGGLARFFPHCAALHGGLPIGYGPDFVARHEAKGRNAGWFGAVFPHCAALHGGLRVVLRGGIEGQNLIYLPKNLNWLMLRHLIKILEMLMSLKWHKVGVKAVLMGLLLVVAIAGAQPAQTNQAGLIKEGLAAIDRGDFKRAKVLGEEVLALAEQAGEATADILAALGLLERAHDRLAEFDQALALQLRALTLSEQIYGPQDKQTAIRLWRLGSTYLALARYEQALLLLRRALAISEKNESLEDAETARQMSAIAATLSKLARHEEALALKLRVLAISEKVNGPDHTETATSLNNLAQTYATLGQRDRALPLQQRALSIREKTQGPDHPETAGALINLAGTYEALAQHDKTLPLQQRAIAIYEKTLGPEHPKSALAMNNLAFTYARLARFDMALPIRIRVLEIFEKVSGPDHPNTSIPLNNLAQTYAALGQYERALPLSLRALAIREKALGSEHPVVATVLSNIGQTQQSLGHPEQALPLQQRALAIREKTLGAWHADTASSLQNLAQINVALGLPAQAMPLQQRALSIYQNSSGPAHPNTALALASLASMHLASNDRPFAIALLKQAVNNYQTVRERVAGIGSTELRSYTDSVASTYQRLASALTDAGRLPEAQMVLDMLKEDEQFDFIRRSATPDPGRTRIGYNPTEQGWMSRYQEISGQLAAIGAEQQGLLKLGKQGLSAEQKQRQLSLAADLKVAQAAFDAFMTAMREDFARQGPARQVELAESSVKALADLRSMLAGLGQGSLLLQIYLSEDQVNLLLTGPGVQLARSSKVSAKDLNRQIAAFRRLLRDPKSDPLPAAQALYQLLIAPVAKDLEQAGARTVMLSLDGALRYLPFGALHDGRRYLAQRWNLPLYTSVARERLRDAVAPQWQAAGLGVTRQLGEFAPLPGVEAEIRGIVRGGNGGKAADKSAALAGEVYLDGAFTAQRLKDVSQRQFPVLHIASHFRFSPGTEVNSFLLLGDGQQLTLGDIRQQNYRFDHVDLLTLSACDTGLGGGRDEQGREIEGFGVIAQQQGARAVLATLWPVADQSTAALMADMYRKRQTLQLSKIEALRQAQLALQAQPRYQHPFYWAPFILMGNWK
jgi:CHAT domain-containing protein/tetratricopeptide (TPR) repeat protein